MATITRRVSGTIPQGVDEAIQYQFDFTRQVGEHGAISGVACTLFNQKLSRYENDKLSGSASADGVLVTAQAVSGLAARTLYLLSVACTFANGNEISAVLPIMGEV